MCKRFLQEKKRRQREVKTDGRLEKKEVNKRRDRERKEEVNRKTERRIERMEEKINTGTSTN